MQSTICAAKSSFDPEAAVMYIPEAFRIDDVHALQALVSAYPLGTLITSGTGGLQASPLPFLLKPDVGPHGTLLAHMALANPQLDALRAGGESLVLFYGPQSYVSPSWYPAKRRHGKVVPTWNYAVVQVRGRVRLIEDAGRLREHVVALAAEHEARRNPPWSPDDAPPDFLAQLLQAIAGIEIAIDTIEGKFKLTQNRNPEDREAVVAALASDDDPHRNPTLAAWMRKFGT
ncbi:negative transcriptional regulator [Burkholderiales bacterium GJ-E10]|nr:negative transcriptional regulator [Burkholderiales bacterium GJ-E10]